MLFQQVVPLLSGLFLCLEVYLCDSLSTLEINFFLPAQVHEIGEQVVYFGDKVVVFLLDMLFPMP